MLCATIDAQMIAPAQRHHIGVRVVVQEVDLDIGRPFVEIPKGKRLRRARVDGAAARNVFGMCCFRAADVFFAPFRPL